MVPLIPLSAEHAVRDVFDFGENALPRMLSAICDHPWSGFHRLPLLPSLIKATI
jgi:hypothetical protein